MIRPDQIPDEAMNALLMALRLRKGGKEAIAAALNAWPGMGIEVAQDESEAIILPLPKEGEW